MPSAASSTRYSAPGRIERVGPMLPMGRPGQPDEVRKRAVPAVGRGVLRERRNLRVSGGADICYKRSRGLLRQAGIGTLMTELEFAPFYWRWCCCAC